MRLEVCDCEDCERVECEVGVETGSGQRCRLELSRELRGQVRDRVVLWVLCVLTGPAAEAT